ncbi:hypothetical protein B0H13DRAFT_2272566 [Mycena leptocephala]|nr:hypothetical protein B0H13DRAFT_2272566 [Mycena leptocephala]
MYRIRKMCRGVGLHGVSKQTNLSGSADTANRPDSESYDNYLAREEYARKGLPPPQEASAATPVEAQRAVIDGFFQRGPIVEDGLPFSLAEKGRSLRLFEHVVPRGVKARVSHQTENDSKFSIASDIGTTKNMVYAFCGVVISFIDADWVLREYIFDLIPLDDDHKGRTVGKLIVKRLKKQKIAGKLLCSATDNTSSNGPLNDTIARKCAEITLEATNARNMQIGCGGHVTNIVAQYSVSIARWGLNAVKCPLVYDAEADPDVIAEMQVMKDEIEEVNAKAKESVAMDSDVEEVSEVEDSDASESESEDDDDEMWVDEDDDDEVTLPLKSKPTAGKKKKNVKKVHKVAVYALRSPIRRKKLRKFIRRKAEKQFRHLVLIRSMKIHWNTTFAELERARMLSPAFDAFVSGMTEGLFGQARKLAEKRRKKWDMTSTDWEFVDKLLVALKRWLGTMPYLELDESKWDKTVPVRGRQLLEAVVAKHARTQATVTNTNVPTASAMDVDSGGGVFAMAMALNTASSSVTACDDGRHEIELFLGNISLVPQDFDDPLGGWKNMQGEYDTNTNIIRQKSYYIRIRPALVKISQKFYCLNCCSNLLTVSDNIVAKDVYHRLKNSLDPVMEEHFGKEKLINL